MSGAHAPVPVEAEPRRSEPAWLAHARAPITAFAFLTRVPLAHADMRPEAMARALPWFPLAGLSIGALQALLAYLVAPRLPAPLVAVFVVALGAALTGALHLDGLADVFDGVGGSRGDPARALAIMRDSRIGSFGALALVLHVAAKLAVLSSLLGAQAWTTVLLAPMIARASVVALIVAFPSARADGLGRAFHDRARAWHAVAALGFAIASVCAASPKQLTAFVWTQACAAMFALWLHRRLRGLTGDGYGAAIELAELAFLVGGV